MKPTYDLEKIKSGVDEKTWERAVGLYKAGKVAEFEESPAGFTARVAGSKPYDVAVSESQFSHGDCNCFLGQQGTLCKHIVALAIFAILRGKPMKKN
jgi:uncharacterized Zn finger protein